MDLASGDKKRAKLAPKSRIHYHGTIKLFLRWAVKRDPFPTNHRLLEAAGMERETVTGGETDSFPPRRIPQAVGGR